MLVNLSQTPTVKTTAQPAQPVATPTTKAYNNLKPLEQDTCSINFKGLFSGNKEIMQEYLRIRSQLESIDEEIIDLKEKVDDPDNSSIEAMLQAPRDQLTLIDKFEERIKIKKELEKVELKLAKTPEGLRVIKEYEQAAGRKKMEDLISHMSL